MADFLLHESPMGYSLFKVVHQVDTIGNRMKEVQDSIQDLAKFGKMVRLISFLPFECERFLKRFLLALVGLLIDP